MAGGWGVRELAEKAGITANTVTRIENGTDAKQATMTALQRALEQISEGMWPIRNHREPQWN